MSKYNKSAFYLILFLFLFSTIGAQTNLINSIKLKVGADAMPDTIAPVLDAPFEIPQFKKPYFPKLTIDIGKLGAITNKPITQIVNKAIETISKKGGGVVIVPSGKWKSGRIVLKSNVNLHLSKGAEIHFSAEMKDYLPVVFTRQEGVEMMSSGAFIYANGEENIAVTGYGSIIGPSMNEVIRDSIITDIVIEELINANTPVKDRIFDGLSGRHFYVPKSISPINCKNVYIEGITIKQGLFWNINPIYCENVIIRGVTVESENIPSGDGIDIESCKNVLMEYCTLSNGDDCFTLKAGRCEDGLRVGKPTENVVIRHSLTLKGHGAITCGSETAGWIRNVYAYNCVFNGTERGLRFKTRRNRGGGIENILYKDITMNNAIEALTWDLLGSEKYMGELAKRFPYREIDLLTPVVRNIHIKNFTVVSAKSFIVANCIPEIPLSNVIIEDGNIKCNKIFNPIFDVKGFVLKNLNIQAQSNDIKIYNGQNVMFENVSMNVFSQESIK